MGASSWPVQISTPMEPIPEAGNSLSPMCVFYGGSCFICHHNLKNPECPAAANPELSCKVRKTCGEMSLHSSKVLRDLAMATRTMTVPSPVNITMATAVKAAESLRSELAENTALLQVMHVAVTATLLADLVDRVKEIAECVDVLARLAHFKNPEDTKNVVVSTVSRGIDEPLPDVVIL
uniref:Uncharacterized protein n=1 Tax=Aegilops tauschii subsp. strangulata TaxID=200361 RepID=A0A453IVF6_AEGTS